jgi:hypothetical protein
MKKINVDVYGQEILVFSSFKKLENWIKKNPVSEEEMNQLNQLMGHAHGFAGICRTLDDQDHWFIVLKEKDLITLTHECLHIAYMMLDAIGVEHDVENHEALCYLHHYIFGEAGKILGMIEK